MAGIVVFTIQQWYVYLINQIYMFLSICVLFKVGVVILLFINAVKVVGCLFKFFGPLLLKKR